MSEEQIIDKVSMIDQWKVSGDSYTQGELDAIGQLLELYYDNKKQLKQEKEKNTELRIQISARETVVEELQEDNLDLKEKNRLIEEDATVDEIYEKINKYKKLTAKQEKMMELMVNWIDDHEDPFEGCHENGKCENELIPCKECIKHYFEKKAEEK